MTIALRKRWTPIARAVALLRKGGADASTYQNAIHVDALTSAGWLRNTRTGPSTCIGSDGTVQWGPHNLLGESLSATLFAAGGTTPPTVMDYQTFAGELCTSALLTSAMTAGYAGTRFARGYADGAPCVQNKSYIQSNYIGLSRALTGSESIILYWTGAFAANTFTITSANSGQFVGVLARAPVASSVCTVTGNIYPVVYLGSALSSNLTVYTNKGMMEDVTGTNRTTPSPYVDSTVGNRLGYSNDFTNAAWTKTNVSVQANSCTGPTSQPAHTLTASSANGTVVQSLTLAGVYTSGLMIRRRTGSGAISIRKSDASAYVAQTITTSWALISNDSGTSGGTAYCAIQMATSGDKIDVCDARLVPGASAATYVYNPFAAPTVGPIYSGRTDYDPVTLVSKGTLVEEARTNLLLNSAAPATQTVTVTTQSYTISFWGTGTCTLTGTASGTLTGSGANVRSTLTVSATAGAVLCTFSGSTTNGQIEDGLTATSYIPTAGSTVTRTADTALVGFDNLAQVWPWVMDANLLVSPDTPATQNVTTTAQQYTLQMQGTGTCTLSGTATGTLTGTGASNVVMLTFTATAGTLTLTFAGSNTNGKLNPGPVAQTYYPNSVKQATIVVEGDLTFSNAADVAVMSLENTSSNRVLLYKSGSQLYGYLNAANALAGTLNSRTAFKTAIGFSTSAASVLLNGGTDTAITPSAFAVPPNVLKLGASAGLSVASAMHIKRLRLLTSNLTAA